MTDSFVHENIHSQHSPRCVKIGKRAASPCASHLFFVRVSASIDDCRPLFPDAALAERADETDSPTNYCSAAAPYSDLEVDLMTCAAQQRNQTYSYSDNAADVI